MTYGRTINNKIVYELFEWLQDYPLQNTVTGAKQRNGVSANTGMSKAIDKYPNH